MNHFSICLFKYLFSCIFRYLFEYMWRERIRRSGEDLFTSFLKLIAKRQNVVTPEEDLPKVFCSSNIYVSNIICSTLSKWTHPSGIVSSVVIQCQIKRIRGFTCKETVLRDLRGRTSVHTVELNSPASNLLLHTQVDGARRGLQRTESYVSWCF